ncbi:hypothetical protein AAMO2058_000805700 [Amorphochlora amoebiformis]
MGSNNSSKGSGKEEDVLKAILLDKKKITNEDIKRIWNFFNCNKSGTLDLEEVCTMQRMRVKLFKEDALKQCLFEKQATEKIENLASELSQFPENLWFQLDLNKDGTVKWEEFKTVAQELILLSPFHEIIEEYKRRISGVVNVDAKGDNKIPEDRPSQSIDSVLPTEFLEIATTSDTVASLKPYGWQGVINRAQDKKSNILMIRFPFAVCYAHIKNVELHLEKHEPDQPGNKYALENTPLWSRDMLNSPGLEGASFYMKVAMGQLDDTDIALLSEEEMMLLLPWLLTYEPNPTDVKTRIWTL